MKIIIKNYKSIVNLEYEIKNNIQYLVGKNESGKSNILDAILEIFNNNIDEKDKNHNFPKKETTISYSFIDLKRKKIENQIDIKSNFKLKIKKLFTEEEYKKSKLIKSLKNWKQKNEEFEFLKKIIKFFIKEKSFSLMKEKNFSLMNEKSFSLMNEKSFSLMKKKFDKLILNDSKIHLFLITNFKFYTVKNASEWIKFIKLVKEEFLFFDRINKKIPEYPKKNK